MITSEKSGNSVRGSVGFMQFGLLLGFSALIILALGLFGWGLSKQFRNHAVQQIRTELLTHIDYLNTQFTIDAKGRPDFLNEFADPRFNQRHSGLYWQIDHLDRKGETLRVGLLRSPSLQGYTLKFSEHDMQVGVISQSRVTGPTGGTLRALKLFVSITPRGAPPVDNAKEGEFLSENVRVRLIVAADEAKLLEGIDDLERALWLTFLVLAVIMIAAETAQLFLVHLPLQRLYLSLEAVRSGQSSQIEGVYSGKMKILVDEFNRLLMQNVEMLKGTRKQVDNLAKAMKPPLDTMRDAAENQQQTLADLSSVVSTQVGVAHQTINHHLANSQAVALALKSKFRCEVFPVLENMVRRMEKVYAEKQLALSIHTQKPSPFFRGEMQDLRDILGNLLYKACQWAERRVEIQLVSSERHILVVIEDDGLGMTADNAEEEMPEHSSTVPGNKLVPGSELDFAEMRELLSLYNGRLEQRHAKLGGIQVRLTLPRAI